MQPIEVTQYNLRDGTLYLATSPYIDGYALEEKEEDAVAIVIQAIALKILQESAQIQEDRCPGS